MSQRATSLKPMPQPDEASAPFFDAARRGTLLIKSCRACAAALGPDARFCSECLSEDVEWKEASGRGTLFTFGIMHQKYPGFEDDVPYNIAVVQLEEGIRMNSSVVGCPNDSLAVGMALTVLFEDAGNGTPIPYFTPRRAEA